MQDGYRLSCMKTRPSYRNTPPHTGYSSQASLTLRHVSGVKRGLDMIKHKKYRFIHNQDPLYMLDIWMRVHVLERQKFHGCRYTTSPVFPGILRMGLLSGRPNSTHLYTQTTRLNANQPRPLAQRRRGLAQVKPRILSVAWAA